ncbi:unnamed protein product, partial [Oppiella nova]
MVGLELCIKHSLFRIIHNMLLRKLLYKTSKGTGGPAVLYIQMELCSFNLQYVTQLKKTCFKTQPYKGVGHVEYFIAYHLFKEILEAVDYLHTRVPPIIHRDLKPTNILVLLNLAQKRCIKLGGFGLATVHKSASQSHTRGVGTHKYIAPEVASGRTYNTKADVYNRKIEYREIKILSKLNDEYVIKYYDSWRESEQGQGDPNELYIQMELCSFNLGELLVKKNTYFNSALYMSSGLGMEYFIAYHLFKEILEAVEYVHTQEPPIIHRDLNPRNILILFNLEHNRCIKLGDFGLAKEQTSESQTNTGWVGTRNYRAPEVERGTKKYNTKADIYSIAIFTDELFNFDVHDDANIENREIDILSKLDANYVVKYYDSWLETSMGTGGPAVLYIQMELCSFNLRYVTTLKKTCFKTQPNKGDLMELCSFNLRYVTTLKKTCFKTQPNKGVGHVEYFISYHLFKEIIEAVDYLHTRVPQIIHRDLKPANILVLLNLAQKRCIKLGDFGLAKVHASASQSHTRGAGAQRYIAPEVASGRSYNTKADVYSIGIFVEELFNIDINKSTEYPGLIDLMNEMLTYVYDKRPSCHDILQKIKHPDILYDINRDQELLDASRSGNYPLVEKILSYRSKKSGPLA